VQRLFATFPDGRPGVALLILRITLAAVLVLDGSSFWPFRGAALLCDILACLLFIGFLIPYVALAGVLSGAIISFVRGFVGINQGTFFLLVLLATGLLGAGSYSTDAFIFGRRRVVIRKMREENY